MTRRIDDRIKDAFIEWLEGIGYEKVSALAAFRAGWYSREAALPKREVD